MKISETITPKATVYISWQWEDPTTKRGFGLTRPIKSKKDGYKVIDELFAWWKRYQEGTTVK